MKKLFPLLLVLLMLAGCASPASQTAASKDVCSIKVLGSKGATVLDAETYLEEGMSVLSATEQALNDNNLTMEVVGAGEMAYVNGIAQLFAGDEGPNSGWLFYINGELPDKGCTVITVKPNDQIEWVFVEDFNAIEW